MSTGDRWNEPILSVTSVKRQHYVPQMYLRQFSGTDGKVRVIDLDDRDRTFRTSLLNAAVEARLYDLEIDGQVYSAESWLSDLEGLSAPIIQQLIDDPTIITSLSLEDEVILARFIAALYFRTPTFDDETSSIVDSMLQEMKDKIKAQVFHQYGPKEAEEIWAELANRPDHEWWGREEPPQSAEMTIDMLGEVQGWANILLAAPWRLGRVPDSSRLYTSDNPVARYLNPVRPWWDHGMFSTFTYYVALSPTTLLKIERRIDEGGELKPRGHRSRQDFSTWESSVARHVVTINANRFLYGEGIVVTRNCAEACLQTIDRASVDIAIRYQGYDPNPPAPP